MDSPVNQLHSLLGINWFVSILSKQMILVIGLLVFIFPVRGITFYDSPWQSNIYVRLGPHKEIILTPLLYGIMPQWGPFHPQILPQFLGISQQELAILVQLVESQDVLICSYTGWVNGYCLFLGCYCFCFLCKDKNVSARTTLCLAGKKSWGSTE